MSSYYNGHNEKLSKLASSSNGLIIRIFKWIYLVSSHIVETHHPENKRFCVGLFTLPPCWLLWLVISWQVYAMSWSEWPLGVIVSSFVGFLSRFDLVSSCWKQKNCFYHRLCPLVPCIVSPYQWKLFMYFNKKKVVFKIQNITTPKWLFSMGFSIIKNLLFILREVISLLTTPKWVDN